MSFSPRLDESYNTKGVIFVSKFIMYIQYVQYLSVWYTSEQHLRVQKMCLELYENVLMEVISLVQNLLKEIMLCENITDGISTYEAVMEK